MANEGGDDTKRRLLDAAGEIIANVGYKAATVRDICRLAQANVAAVHYHFGDKMGLYTALLSEAFTEGLRRYPTDLGLPPTAPAEERLHAFVHSFLLRMLGDGRFAWCGKIMAREMQEPTEALDHLVTHHIEPLAQQIRGIIAEILGGGATRDDERTQLCSMSVVGQCQHILRSRAVIGRITPALHYDEAGIADLARHITTFSLCALRNFPKA
jgi:AcrR family transcriptional regulator